MEGQVEGKMKVARSLLRRNDDAQLKVPAFFGARQRTGWNYDESYREDSLLTVNFGLWKKKRNNLTVIHLFSQGVRR